MTSELAWFKSSYSDGSGGACVEVANTPAVIHVRDSKDRSGPALSFSPESWAAFVGYAADAEV
jgi:Domain of unknown function (DUF397)